MASVEITAAELLDALREATGEVGPVDALTSSEMCERTGWSVKRIAKHLRAVKQAGRLQVVTVKREALDGRLISVPAYRFIRAPKAKR